MECSRFQLKLGIALSALWFMTGSAWCSDRIALVIGNQNYTKEVGPLTNPHNDVNLVKKALEQLGFTVLPPMKDATRKQMLSSTKALAQKLRAAGPGAIGVLYYSGHGFANPDTRANYLIPVDLKEIADDDAWIDAVKLDDLLFELATIAREARRFVLLDACRTELRLPYKAVTVGLGFEQPLDVTGMFLGFSTAPGMVATDKGDKSGPYAQALAEQLVVGGLSHAQIFQNIKERVYETTKGKQTPFESNGIVKGIIFREAALTDAGPRLAQAQQLWEQIKGSENVALLQAFVDAFPAMPQANEARMIQVRIVAQRVAAAATSLTGPVWAGSVEQKRELATSAIVNVLFATNRQRAPDATATFAARPAANISYGYARVRSADPALPVERKRLVETFALGETEWLLNVRQQFEQSKFDEAKDAIVFIPGLNLDFDEAIGKGAQVVRELDFRGPIFVFSWPSSGKAWSYLRDSESAVAAAEEIGAFIRLIRLQSGARKVHIIVEGLGAKALLPLLSGTPQGLGHGAPIGQLIFVGADVDPVLFSRSLGAVKDISERTTLYASSNDAALVLSRQLTGRAAAGSIINGKATLVEGVDTIDVSALVQSWFSLNSLTVGSQAQVVRDIAQLVREGRPPAMRAGLARMDTPEGTIWVMAPPGR